MPKAKGRHPEKALTTVQVRSLGPGLHADGHGLYLRVEPNGARRWIQRLVIRGARRDIGLGSAGLVSLADARSAALENRALARSGGDPFAKKRAAQAIPSFSEAVETYLNGKKLGEFRSEKHRQQWRNSLNDYATPVLGSKPVDTIQMQDVLQVLAPIWSEKTVTASRLRGRIEAVLSAATVAGHRTGDNPARWKGNLSELLSKPTKTAKAEHRPAIALDDASRWFADLQKREGMPARALEFIALTAARSGEVRGMEWTEVDLDKGLWTVPAERMKMDREHLVPLTAEAVALLHDLARLRDETGKMVPYVFFAPRGGKLSDMSVSVVMKQMQEAETKSGRRGWLDTRSGLPAVPHGLRSTFRDWAAERTEFPHEMAEIALAHTVGSSVERAYRRGQMVERRRLMMAAWDRFLRGQQDG